MENIIALESQIIKKEKECKKILVPVSYIILKRIVDIVLSLVLLIILMPVFILTAMAIKLDSRGPVIFKQKRVGKNRRIFIMYKFRTMVVNAEEAYADVLRERIFRYKVIEKNPAVVGIDPRITKVGQFIRKYSIDELPQLFNVLIGNMSLIGPRPIQQIEFDQLDKEWYKLRNEVLPGISGLWQVSGRSNLSTEQRFELDYEYVMNLSLWQDMKLILKTIPAVFRCEGAG